VSGRGKAQKNLDLIEAARTTLEEIQPTSVRSVCYQLLGQKLITSMTKANTNAVGAQLVYAREQGIIPWPWITDETREIEHVSTWNDPEQIIRAAINGYRKNYHTDQPCRIRVVSEKGTIAGTVRPVLNEYGIDFQVLHGFGSATAVHDIAAFSGKSEKPLVLIYIGDWDPSGLCMSARDLPKRIDEYGGAVEIVRVALTKSDVGKNTKLPFFPIESKSKDPRYKWFRENYGTRCWELDALSPVILRKRVENAIVSRLDIAAWNHSIKIEAAERESMSGILTTWKKSISRQASKYSQEGAS